MIKTIVETVKKIHKEDLVLIKIGGFFHAYGKDAYILSYFFEYKLKNDDGIVSCGFPVNSLKKVESKLEDEKVNYLVLDRRDNYSVDEVYDNKNLNNYQKVYEKARRDVSYMMRVDKICLYLKRNYKRNECKKKIIMIEELINETRKV